MIRPSRIAALATAILVGAAATALAADPPQLKVLKKRYETLAKNQGGDGNRERRYVILDLYDYRTHKTCRSLLRKAYDDERDVDNRTSVVHVLAGTGETKDIDTLVSAFRKDEKARAPIIAFATGLSYTPDEKKAEIAERLGKHLKKAKEDVRLSIIEGLGNLQDPSAAAPLMTLQKKLLSEDQFERNIALGKTGDDAAIAMMMADAGHPHPDVRLGATLGLGAAATDAAITQLSQLVLDSDDRISRAAVDGLGAIERVADAEHQAALEAIVSVLKGADRIRTKESCRQALRTLLGVDMAYDAAGWRRAAKLKRDGGAMPTGLAAPELPTFFGMPVASDSVLLLIDTSGSMEWNGRMTRMVDECKRLVGTLPDSTLFGIVDVARDIRPFAEGLVSGAASRASAIEWLDAIETRRDFRLHDPLLAANDDFNGIDTILIATDSHPTARTLTGRSARETMESFRRQNRIDRLTLQITYVMPGGRYEEAELSELEIDERVDYLTEMTETSGGSFVHITE